MTLAKIALLVGMTPVLVGGSAYVATLAGDLRWLPISSYQTEKLYDLQDEASDLEAKEKYEGTLTQREAERLKRLKLRIDRLQQEIN